MIGRTVMPGVFMSTSRNEMPSCRFAAFGIGAHQHEAPVGMMRGRGPDLLAVHHVMVAVALRRGLQRGEVGSGARLGKALAPPIVEVGGARQEALLLLLGAELDQHRADHGDVERRTAPAPAPPGSPPGRSCAGSASSRGRPIPSARKAPPSRACSGCAASAPCLPCAAHSRAASVRGCRRAGCRG